MHDQLNPDFYNEKDLPEAKNATTLLGLLLRENKYLVLRQHVHAR